MSKKQDKSEAIWRDFNNDGLVDLICKSFDGKHQVLLNDKGTGMLLNNFTTLSLYDQQNRLLGVTCSRDEINQTVVSWGNFDGDKWLDLYCSTLDGRHLVFKNQQNGKMVMAYDSGIGW
ncbi:MAG: hypothetical protein EOO89_32160, partial [Pedobacter sp.]